MKKIITIITISSAAFALDPQLQALGVMEKKEMPKNIQKNKISKELEYIQKYIQEEEEQIPEKYKDIYFYGFEEVGNGKGMKIIRNKETKKEVIFLTGDKKRYENLELFFDGEKIHVKKLYKKRKKKKNLTDFKKNDKMQNQKKTQEAKNDNNQRNHI